MSASPLAQITMMPRDSYTRGPSIGATIARPRAMMDATMPSISGKNTIVHALIAPGLGDRNGYVPGDVWYRYAPGSPPHVIGWWRFADGDWVQQAVDLLEGRNTLTVRQIQNDMEAAAERLDFEKAAVIRDEIKRIKKIARL